MPATWEKNYIKKKSYLLQFLFDLHTSQFHHLLGRQQHFFP